MEIDNDKSFKKAQKLADKFAELEGRSHVLWLQKWGKMDMIVVPSCFYIIC